MQPLLRNGGRAYVLETLTITERALLSNLRAFQFYRQGFYTNVVVGSGNVSGATRSGGFFGGTGLTGFSGQGAGGFGGVGSGTFGIQGGGGGGGGGARQVPVSSAAVPDWSAATSDYCSRNSRSPTCSSISIRCSERWGCSRPTSTPG